MCQNEKKYVNPLSNNTPTDSLASWLEKYIKRRISKDLRLTFCLSTGCWNIRFSSSQCCIWIPLNRLFYGEGKSFYGLPHIIYNLDSIPGATFESLAAPGGFATKTLMSWTNMNRDIRIDYDLLSMAYWMLSRCEEIDSSSCLDEHGRFRATETHAFRHGYLESPIVDQWFVVLKRICLILWPSLNTVETSYRVLPTHDVDFPSVFRFRSTKDRAKLLLEIISSSNPPISKRGLIKMIMGLAKSDLSRHDPYNTFEWLMDTNRRHSVSAIFYFLSRTTRSEYDPRYSADNRTIQALMRYVARDGNQIGLHPSYNASDCSKRLDYEVSAYNSSIKNAGIACSSDYTHVRMHYLRARIPDTFNWLSRSGRFIDSSIGFADYPGFRAGTCHSYSFFDSVRQLDTGIEEQPLILMDATLLRAQCASSEKHVERLRLIRALQKSCKSVNGTFAFLWHNSSFLEEWSKEVYNYILAGNKECNLAQERALR